jgi:hypothetical protein
MIPPRDLVREVQVAEAGLEKQHLTRNIRFLTGPISRSQMSPSGAQREAATTTKIEKANCRHKANISRRGSCNCASAGVRLGRTATRKISMSQSGSITAERFVFTGVHVRAFRPGQHSRKELQGWAYSDQSRHLFCSHWPAPFFMNSWNARALTADLPRD